MKQKTIILTDLSQHKSTVRTTKISILKTVKINENNPFKQSVINTPLK